MRRFHIVTICTTPSATFEPRCRTQLRSKCSVSRTVLVASKGAIPYWTAELEESIWLSQAYLFDSRFKAMGKGHNIRKGRFLTEHVRWAVCDSEDSTVLDCWAPHESVSELSLVHNWYIGVSMKDYAHSAMPNSD